jgi:hypothetical protein
MTKDLGASQATGLGGAEAPEPPSRLGPSDAIPSAVPLGCALTKPIVSGRSEGCTAETCLGCLRGSAMGKTAHVC